MHMFHQCSTKHTTTIMWIGSLFPNLYADRTRNQERGAMNIVRQIYMVSYFWILLGNIKICFFLQERYKAALGRFFGQRSIALWLAAIGDIDSDSWICIFPKSYLWKDLTVYILIYINSIYTHIYIYKWYCNKMCAVYIVGISWGH